MQYLDASFIVAILTREPRSDDLRAWLDTQSPDDLCVSGWVSTEVSSALSIKQRTGDLTPEDRANSLAVWHRMLEDNFAIETIVSEHFDIAARLCDQPGINVRAGDALHLAICSTAGHHLVTLDRAMADTALTLGIPALVP